MYSSFDQASRSLVEELDKGAKFPPSKRAYLRSVLTRALKADTNDTLTRVDFLTPERVSRALDGVPEGPALRETIKLLFPRTWLIVENCK